MGESYFNCCGMCVHLNLYDRYSGKFKCAEWNRYCRADETACSNRFEPDRRRSPRDVDKAREGRL